MAKAEAIQRFRGLSSRYQISLVEWYILCAIAEKPLFKGAIREGAFVMSNRMPFGKIWEGDVDNAMKALVDRSLLRCVNEATVEGLRKIATAESQKEPVYGYPQRLQYDFTPLGAATFHDLYRAITGHQYWCEAISRTSDAVIIYTPHAHRANIIKKHLWATIPSVAIRHHCLKSWRAYWWLPCNQGVMMVCSSGSLARHVPDMY